MRIIILLVCFLGHAFSYPVDEPEEEYSSQPGMNGLKILDENLMVGWNINYQTGELKLQIDMDIDSSWLIFGFETIPRKNEISQRLMFISVDLSERSIRLKTVQHLNSKLLMVPNQQRLYNWESKQLDSANHLFKFNLTRDIVALPISSPISLIYAYGVNDEYNEIGSEIYVDPDKLQYAILALNDPLSLKLLSRKPIRADINPTTPTATTTTTTTTTTTAATRSTIKTRTTATTTTRQTAKSITQRKTSSVHKETKPSARKTVESTIEKSQIFSSKRVDDGIKKTAVGTASPCPQIKCNCSKEEKTPWYDVLNAKDNSIYFSIIGASALLTGLVVLCVACCCASSAKAIPRTRTHKVAFYKVDDLASETEEEVEFLKSEKE